jgi:hypothetical protein
VEGDANLYDDGRIACDEDGVRIRWYYLWGPKWIPYSAMRSVHSRPLSPVRGKWRIWGSGDFVHWCNLDPGRTGKETAIEIDTGGRILPTITPDDPAEVERIIRAHLAA